MISAWKGLGWAEITRHGNITKFRNKASYCSPKKTVLIRSRKKSVSFSFGKKASVSVSAKILLSSFSGSWVFLFRSYFLKLSRKTAHQYKNNEFKIPSFIFWIYPNESREKANQVRKVFLFSFEEHMSSHGRNHFSLLISANLFLPEYVISQCKSLRVFDYSEPWIFHPAGCVVLLLGQHILS